MTSLLPCIRQRKRECYPRLENETNGTDRIIDVEGAFNVRDFGGISLSPTKATRPGVIFRSGHLEFLTDTGETKLSKLGITAIIDLRTSSEAKLIQKWAYANGLSTANKHQLPPALPFPLSEAFHLDDRFLKYKSEDAMRSQSVARRYFDTVCSENGRAKMRELLVFMHEHSSDAFILHCSLGKDRTGVVVALLLALLGASDDQIADDFALSGPGLEPMFAQTMKFIGEYYPNYTEAELREAVVQMLTPNRQAMLILLQMMREEFGGPMEFFRDGCNVDSSVLLSLKELLTEPRDWDSGRGWCYVSARIRRILMSLSLCG
ncbi:hypothetical protein BM221_001306 [Beauveria bassiana]|uniref:Tyrosine specific protein phosphatases domain-containing protein n=1 Tax=Beauveria bassiana TaxID=176275 RepID=A0A2N6P2X5_BEABA|nr:hypothetical protein BM221_001306 [Beauveria bassiana]